MAEAKVTINRPNSACTPPDCAICLGPCTNKCFSDSCMHQFCFHCLLEWSKVKAECPLCKQQFKSIIHNVKSNEEYEEHVVEAPRNDNVRAIGNDEYLFLPLSIPQRHEFHVRTTFAVDSGGEHAIQQMLLSHPLISGRLTVGTDYPSIRLLNPRHRRENNNTCAFRRSIYEQNLWAQALPDITGHYRECSPSFYRNNPAARQRLVPWLNRELNAILEENTQLTMTLVDLILQHLLRHHICSGTFRNLLREYLNDKTDHFIHEFYNFMRSPYDMTGYDRSMFYTSRPESPAPFLDESEDTVEVPDDDSDVVLVSASNPAEPVTINLVDSDSDEPIMISSTSNAVPMPILHQSRRSLTPEDRPTTPAVVNLPPKLRHKHKSFFNMQKWKWMKKRQRHRTVSASSGRSRSSSSSSSSSSDVSDKGHYKKYKKRRIIKKGKYKKRPDTNSSSDNDMEVNVTSESDTDDNKPLIDIVKRKYKSKSKKTKKEKRRRSKHSETYRIRDLIKLDTPKEQQQPMDLSIDAPSCSSKFRPMNLSVDSPGGSRHSSSSALSPHQHTQIKSKGDALTSRYHVELPRSSKSKMEPADNGQYASSVENKTFRDIPNYHDEPSSSRTKIKIFRNGRHSPKHSRTKAEPDESSSDSYRTPTVKSEIREAKYENPGPSTSKTLPLVFRREQNKWYVFNESDSSD